jgi:hypothetical protein
MLTTFLSFAAAVLAVVGCCCAEGRLRSSRRGYENMKNSPVAIEVQPGDQIPAPVAIARRS